MNETRKAIIKLIEPYMDKKLSVGCLIKSKLLSLYPESEAEIGQILIVGTFCKQGNTNIKNFQVMNGYTEELEKFDFEDIANYKIIGHYDITAALKYIDSIKIEKEINWETREKGLVSKYKIEFSKDFEYFKIRDNGYHLDNFKFPNKPIHLYDVNEEKDLLELLTKLKSYE